MFLDTPTTKDTPSISSEQFRSLTAVWCAQQLSILHQLWFFIDESRPGADVVVGGSAHFELCILKNLKWEKIVLMKGATIVPLWEEYIFDDAFLEFSDDKWTFVWISVEIYGERHLYVLQNNQGRLEFCLLEVNPPCITHDDIRFAVSSLLTT